MTLMPNEPVQTIEKPAPRVVMRAINMDVQRKAADRWKKANPDYWKGRAMVDALEQAIKNQNPNAKVWLLSGFSFRKWIGRVSQSLAIATSIESGWKLKPIIGWRNFDMSKPAQVRKFLHPANFLVLPVKNTEITYGKDPHADTIK